GRRRGGRHHRRRVLARSLPGRRRPADRSTCGHGRGRHLPGGAGRHADGSRGGQVAGGRVLRDGRRRRGDRRDCPGRHARDPARQERRAQPRATARRTGGTGVMTVTEARAPRAAAPPLRPLAAQTGAELYMTLRRGETLLLTLGIPVVFLLFFSKVNVVSTPTATPANFFVPGILALAVMSTAMVSLGIATGFERGYGVLKRLGCTPLGRPRLLGAKIVTILAVELLQAAVLLPVGIGLGWNPGGGGPPAVAAALGAIVLGSTAFAGVGLFMAGTLRAEVNLAAANGLYLILLLLGGMIVPISKLPAAVQDIAKLLPAEALSAALHATLGSGAAPPAESWIVLAVWAVAAPAAAALTFRWE